MPSSFEILQHSAQALGATVQRHPGLHWLLLTKGTNAVEVWFTDTGNISRADIFSLDSPDLRDPVQGRHLRRQILRHLRSA